MRTFEFDLENWKHLTGASGTVLGTLILGILLRGGCSSDIRDREEFKSLAAEKKAREEELAKKAHEIIAINERHSREKEVDQLKLERDALRTTVTEKDKELAAAKKAVEEADKTVKKATDGFDKEKAELAKEWERLKKEKEEVEKRISVLDKLTEIAVQEEVKKAQTKKDLDFLILVTNERFRYQPFTQANRNIKEAIIDDANKKAMEEVKRIKDEADQERKRLRKPL